MAGKSETVWWKLYGVRKNSHYDRIRIKTKEMDLKQESEDADSKSKENPDGSKKRDRNASTVLQQWDDEEEEKYCKQHLLIVTLYYGAERECSAARLAKHDVVITTHKLAMRKYDKEVLLFRIKWTRIILDEAHVVHNHKTRTSLIMCSLSDKSRWALTDMAVYNKELDLYAILKFLRCSPFDDLHVWELHSLSAP